MGNSITKLKEGELDDVTIKFQKTKDESNIKIEHTNGKVETFSGNEFKISVLDEKIASPSPQIVEDNPGHDTFTKEKDNAEIPTTNTNINTSTAPTTSTTSITNIKENEMKDKDNYNISVKVDIVNNPSQSKGKEKCDAQPEEPSQPEESSQSKGKEKCNTQPEQKDTSFISYYCMKKMRCKDLGKGVFSYSRTKNIRNHHYYFEHRKVVVGEKGKIITTYPGNNLKLVMDQDEDVPDDQYYFTTKEHIHEYICLGENIYEIEFTCGIHELKIDKVGKNEWTSKNIKLGKSWNIYDENIQRHFPNITNDHILSSASSSFDIREIDNLLERGLKDTQGYGRAIASIEGFLAGLQVYEAYGYSLHGYESQEEEKEDFFIWACIYGRISIVKYLFEKVNSTYRERGLSDAVHFGHTKIVKYLLEKGTKMKDSKRFLEVASCQGYYLIAKLLLKHGVSADNEDALCYAHFNKFYAIRNLIMLSSSNPGLYGDIVFGNYYFDNSDSEPEDMSV